MSKIEVNTVAPQCGTTLTLGESGDTVVLGTGASQSGFGRSGSVNWQTTKKTGNFTAADGEGYFVDTSSGGVTASLPAGSAGAIVSFADYTRTFGTNALTISPNGSEKIGGVADDATLTVDGQAATFVYVDATEGWVNVQNAEDTETGAAFISATGGEITTCGDFKIHTFFGPGTFCVSSVATLAANNEVSYMVVAGGGGGAAGNTPAHAAGGGGAGGFRENKSGVDTYTASPLNGAGAITVTATGFPITVGAGGPSGPGCASVRGCNGSPSIFSTKTSTGGGGGGGSSTAPTTGGNTGGSGGGGASEGPGPGANPSPTSGGAGGGGNTPPVSPSQGNNGGYGNNGPGPSLTTGGGGGATAVGANGSPPGPSNGVGGAGAATQINITTVPGKPGGAGQIGTPSPTTARTFAGGGGGGGTVGNTTGGAGGTGGGATGVSPNASGTAATINTGGGGGGGGGGPPVGSTGTNGGSGIVVIRYKYQ